MAHVCFSTYLKLYSLKSNTLMAVTHTRVFFFLSFFRAHWTIYFQLLPHCLHPVCRSHLLHITWQTCCSSQVNQTDIFIFCPWQDRRCYSTASNSLLQHSK